MKKLVCHYIIICRVTLLCYRVLGNETSQETERNSAPLYLSRKLFREMASVRALPRDVCNSMQVFEFINVDRSSPFTRTLCLTLKIKSVCFNAN